ncbi:LacI family DNA-binding transcriptional regulator [Catenulispora rubra]|uniref:LacI family DNA-binding transcriptional regulator n=1 Tax=Catenulispora rubra TaxID=280293 RepID=UPI0018923BE1|nr:LacI family DNA-binding transcriptional regulator [Catenulispora rubra]
MAVTQDKPLAEGGEEAGTAARAPSMRDVADLAGYSHQTVSRVLSGHPNVRARTRLRVMAAIQDLGYRPNLAARALATGSSQTVGVVVLNGTLHGPSSMLYAIEEAAQFAGYGVTVASVRGFDRTLLRRAIARLADQAVDGVIVVAPLASVRDALEELPQDTPSVIVDGDPDDCSALVRVDQTLGARRATEHLLTLGHSTVWHVAGPADWPHSQGRVAGWKAALAAAGAEETVPLPGDWSAESGYRAGQLLARMPDVTAVFAANDSMALGALRALSERGRRVPEDVSIVGFDDIPEAAYLSPPLTTVRQDFHRVGLRSLALLLDQIAERANPPHDVVIEPELIVRLSTAPPPL